MLLLIFTFGIFVQKLRQLESKKRYLFKRYLIDNGKTGWIKNKLDVNTAEIKRWREITLTKYLCHDLEEMTEVSGD